MKFADIETYLPHRPPMCLVSQLLYVEDDYAEARAILNAGDAGIGPDGKVEATALMEMVAQSYAAAQGYLKQRDNKPTLFGYLVGIKDFRIEELPSAGKHLLIKVKSASSFDNFYVIDGQVFCENRLMAGGTLKIWATDNIELLNNNQRASDGLRPV
jgi:predicted hotdog family 3-hydroxylacyl-ACP dehydratase